MILSQGLLVVSVIVLSATLGGGIYEHVVLDPVWPSHPSLIQSAAHGGLTRARFWLPAHLLFEILLVSSLALFWKSPSVRIWLLLAVCGHVIARVWSALYFIPRARAFERADIVDEAMARRWTFRSKFRLPIELLTLALLLNGLRVALGR
jgi:hypothetical protein